jgi:ferredoxin-NADP reductase
LRFKNQEDSAQFNYLPGQYIFIILKKKTEKGEIDLPKPYSIASSPSEFRKQGYFEIAIKMITDGYASNYLCSLISGKELEILGPLGQFVLKGYDKDCVFLATGTGISAIKPMLKTLLENDFKKDVWLFFGIRTENEIIYREEFEALAEKHKNFHFVPCLSREPENSKFGGFRGYVQDAMEKHLKDYKNKDFYVCGLLKMVEDVKQFLEKKRVAPERIHFEKYV